MDDKPKDLATKTPQEQGSRMDNLKQIEVGDLQMGMYVAELDRPWLETPFLMQGFELRNKSQLKTLHEYCQYVYINSHSPLTKKKPQPTVRGLAPSLVKKAEKGTLLNRPGQTRSITKKSIVRARKVLTAANQLRQN